MVGGQRTFLIFIVTHLAYITDLKQVMQRHFKGLRSLDSTVVSGEVGPTLVPKFEYEVLASITCVGWTRRVGRKGRRSGGT